MVRHAMFLLPYLTISSYIWGLASLRRLINGLFFSRSASNISKAPLSLAILTEEVYALIATSRCTFSEKSFPSSVPYLIPSRSEEHTSELQSRPHLVCR